MVFSHQKRLFRRGRHSQPLPPIPRNKCRRRPAAICGGKPDIRGTGIKVRHIPGMIAGGYGIEKFLVCYPELKRDGVSAALEDAAQVMDEDQRVAC
ncbi:MAG: DUF433 domain-containing protein [Bryobacterales bacterium]|nr:DUF433 domain-containing protein [Bryobacterales bacterium]